MIYDVPYNIFATPNITSGIEIYFLLMPPFCTKLDLNRLTYNVHVILIQQMCTGLTVTGCDSFAVVTCAKRKVILDGNDMKENFAFNYGRMISGHISIQSKSVKGVS